MVQASPSGPRSAPARPGRRFTRRHRQLRVGLSQLLFVIAGLVLGIFVPRITVPPTVSSGRIVDLLFTAGVTVISLITVIYSLLFLVVQWVAEYLQPAADPIPRRPHRLARVRLLDRYFRLLLHGCLRHRERQDRLGRRCQCWPCFWCSRALLFMRALQTRALTSMLLAPNLDAITERGREILDGLYLQPAAGDQQAGAPLPPLRSTVTWPGRPGRAAATALGSTGGRSPRRGLGRCVPPGRGGHPAQRDAHR